MKQYDFAALAKVAKKEVAMRRVVYGKKVAAGTMEWEAAEAQTQAMQQIAEILDTLTEWKRNKEIVDPSVN